MIAAHLVSVWWQLQYVILILHTKGSQYKSNEWCMCSLFTNDSGSGCQSSLHTGVLCHQGLNLNLFWANICLPSCDSSISEFSQTVTWQLMGRWPSLCAWQPVGYPRHMHCMEHSWVHHAQWLSCAANINWDTHCTSAKEVRIACANMSYPLQLSLASTNADLLLLAVWLGDNHEQTARTRADESREATQHRLEAMREGTSHARRQWRT